MKYLLGIDLGTTAIKVGLFDEKGASVSVASKEYELLTPAPGIVELPCETYKDTFKACLAEIISNSYANAEDIAALSISAQSETLVPVDADGNALRNAIVWMDTRAQAQAEYLLSRFSRQTINHVTGQTDMLAIWPCSKLMWLKEKEPDVFEKADKFLLIEDYFIKWLCGGWFGDYSLWSSSVMLDITEKRWWQEMLDELEISPSRLPALVESGVDIGTLTPETAQELGLSPTTHVVTGGLDGALGALGVGCVRAGIFSESGGSSLTACLPIDEPFFDKKLEMPCFCSPIAGKYLITAFSSGGICYRWTRDKLCGQELAQEEAEGISAYRLMDEQAEGIPAGSEGLTILPHFLGAGMPDTDSHAKCTIAGLTLRHTKAHIIRGFMEGVATVLRRMVDSLEDSGLEISEIRSMGGAANSRLWCQIKCDATGKRIVTLKNTDDSACLGAAMLAGVGIGMWDSPEQAYSGFSGEIKRIYTPDVERKKAYDALCERYRLLMSTLKEVNDKL